MRPILVAVFLAVMPAVLGPSLAAEVPAGTRLAKEQVLRYRVMDQINTLDPQMIEEVDSHAVAANLFEGLATGTEDGGIVPALAEGWEISADGLTYTFHLRDATWSDGQKVVADDLVYAWRRAVDPAIGSSYGYFLALGGIENADAVLSGAMPPDGLGVTAPDAKTLVVKLATRTPFFLSMLTQATLFPVPRHVIEKYGKDWTLVGHIVSNGAYTLKENQPGERLVIERNPLYWNDAKTVLNRVEFISVPENGQALTRFLAGELDYTDIPRGRKQQMVGLVGDQMTIRPQLCTDYLSLNVSETGPVALRDRRVRKALSLAIDRDLLVKSALRDAGLPTFDFTPPYVHGFAAPDLPESHMSQTERDAEAQRLMREAGYGPDHPLTLNLSIVRYESHQIMARVLKQMFRQKLGVNLVTTETENSVLAERMHAKDYEIARTGWCGDYNEASTFLTQLASSTESGMAQNDAGYSNPEVDRLLREAREAEDSGPIYGEAERLIIEDQPIIPLYFGVDTVAISSHLKNWPVNAVTVLWYAKDLYRTED
jgi:oligopeptide transport system substrate-binding protein